MCETIFQPFNSRSEQAVVLTHRFLPAGHVAAHASMLVAATLRPFFNVIPRAIPIGNVSDSG
jgi:hypothetical protein